jgi:hypothetical protein
LTNGVADMDDAVFIFSEAKTVLAEKVAES